MRRKVGYLQKHLVASSPWMHSRKFSPTWQCSYLRTWASGPSGQSQKSLAELTAYGDSTFLRGWFPLATETLNKLLHLLVTLRIIIVSITLTRLCWRHKQPSQPSDLNPCERQNISFLPTYQMEGEGGRFPRENQMWIFYSSIVKA
jgi:hypothetical protein